MLFRSAWHLGFLIGPRVNAGGRVGESSLGARILSTEDPDEARAIAQKLDGYNTERREIEARVLAEAEAQVTANLAKGLGGNSGEDAITFAYGGGPPDTDGIEHPLGPTVLDDVPDEARIMNEEPFGPLAPMQPFSNFDDVMEKANGLPFEIGRAHV